jgi:hypothetical protein
LAASVQVFLQGAVKTVSSDLEYNGLIIIEKEWDGERSHPDLQGTA